MPQMLPDSYRPSVTTTLARVPSLREVDLGGLSQLEAGCCHPAPRPGLSTPYWLLPAPCLPCQDEPSQPSRRNCCNHSSCPPKIFPRSLPVISAISLHLSHLGKLGNLRTRQLAVWLYSKEESDFYIPKTQELHLTLLESTKLLQKPCRFLSLFIDFVHQTCPFPPQNGLSRPMISANRHARH